MSNEWLLDYDGALYMKIPSEDFEEFCRSAFYKLFLKRYVRDIFDGFVRFKKGLTYLDYNKIIGICRREVDKTQRVLTISDALKEYINEKEIYINARYKLGNEIKHQDEKLIERYKEYKSIVDFSMSRKLRDKQMWDSFFMCAMQKSGNFSVPGSGKTSSVLGVYAYLKYKGLINKIIVICPKNAFGSWIDEFKICFNGKENLHFFNIQAPILRNVRERRKALKYDSGNANLLLFNYESLRTYREDIITLIDNNTLLVFDEVHKAKRIDGENAVNAIAIAKNAIFVIAMTGTPIPNTYMDIYNFLQILFPYEYNEFFSFDIGMLRRPDSTDIAEINKKMQPFFCRTTKYQLQVPEANEDVIQSYTATQVENKLFDILKKKYRKNKLALMIRILQLETNPKMLLKSLDLSDFKYILDDTCDVKEIDYVDYSKDVKQLIDMQNPTTKMKACVELARKLVTEGKTIIIWCIFIDSINTIAQRLKSYGIMTKCIYGEVPLEERQEIIDDFKEGRYQVLLTNPHTLAESVSLHKICHDAIYYEYSYNLVHLLQSKDRIHRLGLEKNQYTQYYYLQIAFSNEGEYSMDEQIYLRLKEKEQIMLDAIDADILETMPTSDEELDKIFEKLFY